MSIRALTATIQQDLKRQDTLQTLRVEGFGGAISFTAFISAPPARLHAPLAEAGAQRGRLRDILKRLKRADDKDTLAVIKIIEDYVPYLASVEHCLDHGIFMLDKEIVTSWRCTLTDSKLRNQPRIEQPTIYYEMAFVLLTYAYALVNWASHGMNGTESSDAKLNQAADCLCRAAGVFHYVYETILPKFYAALSLVQASNKQHPPVDISREVVSAHYRLALADAQLLAVKRASQKSSVSPSLMARISSSAADHLSAAQGILASCPAKRELDDDLLTYVSQDRELAQASVYRWMGSDADKAGKVGESIGCINLSLSLLRKLRASKLASISSRAKIEFATVEELARNWQKYNDSVAFEPVLDSATVQDRVPSGREVLAAKTFQSPRLKFGELVDDGDFNERISGLRIEDQGSQSEEETRSYAGKGSYY